MSYNVSITQAKPNLLPTVADDRKKIPLASGVLDYFTSALIEVAKVSQAGNDQHNPGQPLHWSRGKSDDHADTMQRHFLERGTVDTDGMRHSAKMVWRALAVLQLEMEAAGAPISRGSRPVLNGVPINIPATIQSSAINIPDGQTSIMPAIGFTNFDYKV